MGLLRDRLVRMSDEELSDLKKTPSSDRIIGDYLIDEELDKRAKKPRKENAMIASDEQTAVILHGRHGKLEWVEVERPVGKQELPVWLTGLHIDMAMHVANSPYVKFRVSFDPMPKDTLWEQGPKGRYWREHDGVIEQLWHEGALTQIEDGSWETTKQQGFAGRTFTVKLKDGRTVHLRGPWHGGTVDGYSEMIIVNMSDAHNQSKQGRVTYDWGTGPYHKILKAESWTKKGGTFGLYVSHDVLIKAIAKYYPQMRICKWTREYSTIEPFLDEWNMPKSAWQHLQSNLRNGR